MKKSVLTKKRWLLQNNWSKFTFLNEISKIESDWYFVGGRHRSAKTKNYGEIKSKVSKVLTDYCSFCKLRKSMTVSDNAKQAEGLEEIFKNPGKKGLIVSKKMAKDVLKNLGRALEIGANVGTAFASQGPKAAFSSLPDVSNFYHTGKGL